MRRRSDALAAHLVRTLPDDGAPVAVVGHKQPEMLVAFLGCLKAGHPYVPIEAALPRQRIERVIAAAACAAVLTPAEIAARTDAGGRAPERRPRPDDPCYVLFTSGSSGDPKGVVITHACLAAFLAWITAEHAFAPGEAFLNQSSFAFDLSVMDTYGALVSGGTLCSLTRDDIERPRQLYRRLGEWGLTTWVSTPSFAALCLAERRFDATMLPRLRRFLFCGEVLPAGVAGQLLDRFPGAAVWNTYGPTEATVATTSIRIDRDVLARYPSLPIGRPMPGTRVLVADPQGQPLGDGERGEIVIAGPNVGAGYLGRPDLTATAFATHEAARRYRTGDRGYVRDGLLFCDGRLDDQIKLHGHRVELGDVEANLRAVAGVRDAVVLPVLTDGQPQSLTAFVVLGERPEGSDFAVAQTLRARLAERVPAYMLPRRFVVLDALPLTANGKADRRQLAARLT